MKACKHCGAAFEKRRKEAYWQFRERRFCSRACADAGRATTRVENGEFKARYRQKKLPDGSRVLEHRWVVEQHLGRKLESWEQVHHINHDRLDNRVENLEVVTSKEHGLRHSSLPRVKTCAACGQEFMPAPTKRRRAKTCSSACANILRRRPRSPQQAAPKGTP